MTAAAPSTPAPAEQRVTPLELFFDLVFVFAFTQVTALMAASPTSPNLVRGMLVMAVLWWAWVGYAWLTNCVDTGAVPVRAAIFTAMGAMIVVALAVPEAFDRYGVLFALAVGVVRAMFLVLFHISTRDDPAMRTAVDRMAIGLVVGSGLLVAAGLLDGAAQGALFAIAIAIDYLAPLLGGTRGWRVSAGHFAERHALIVIIALGESIVAIGVGAAGLELEAGLVTGAVLGVALAAALWWVYFDVTATAAEHRLRAREGVARNRLARDAYSYLHLPMIAGIVLVALGVKTVIAHVGDPLDGVPAAALCGGAALYLLAHVAFRLRVVGTLSRQRTVAAGLCVAVLPLALAGPGLAALAALVGICAGLAAYEFARFRPARRRVLAGAG